MMMGSNEQEVYWGALKQCIREARGQIEELRTLMTLQNNELQDYRDKFQEKLQELAPIPDLLKATQMRLKDAQQAQAIAEHNAEQLTEANMALKSEIERLKSNVIRMEEFVLAKAKCLQEKIHECAQIGGEFDRAADETARALQCAKVRTETIRNCMWTIALLERQLAASRAQVKAAEMGREEAQVQTLRRTASSTGEGDGEPDQQECTCKTLFDNP